MASAIGAETKGHSVKTFHKATGVRPDNCAAHPIQPAGQTFGWQARNAHPPGPSHSERREDGTASIAGRDPGRGDGSFDLVAVASEARQAPQVIPHARPCDRVETLCGCHEVQPPTRAILETLSAVSSVLGIATVQEGGQVSFRPRTAC